MRLLINLVNIDLTLLYHRDNAPIEPSIAHLNIVAGLIVLKRLQVVNAIDLLAQLVVGMFGVQCMDQADLVALAFPAQSVEHVLRLQLLCLVNEVPRVQAYLVHVQIVHLSDAEKFQIAGLDGAILRVTCAYLEQTI